MSLTKVKYSCSITSVSISFPHSSIFTMPLGITDRIIAATTEWGTSIGMKVFPFKDTVYARLGTLFQGSLSIVLLEVSIDDEFDEVAIFVTFGRREETNASVQQLKPPRSLIDKLVKLLDDMYGGFPITTRPLCMNCQYELDTQLVPEGFTLVEKIACKRCEELCDPLNLNDWPR